MADTRLPPISSPPSPERIEKILSATYATPVTVRAVDRVEPWFVLRCHLSSPVADVPPTVVVKWLRDTAGGVRTDPVQLLTEQAALEFLADVDPDLAPALVAADTAGADPRNGFLVFEDAAPREPLRSILLRDGPRPAAPLLTAFARSLAHLHAGTLGRADAYYDRRLRLGPVDRQTDIERFLGKWRTGVGHMSDAGVAMPAAATRELAGITADIADPGPFLAFSNGDAGVNNYLVDSRAGGEADGRLIDFEAAGFRHAVTDLVNDLYVPGSMWLTVGDPMTNGVEKAYREALAPAVPEVADDRWFGRTLAGAGFVFVACRLANLPKIDDRPFGNHSRLHRVTTLEAAADTAERHRVLPHLTGWARAAAATLRRRWPDTDIDLTTLGPYTARE
ncbi:hypothetical protein ABZV93_27805 [Actinopolymorpha sp. NPDC004070]|uniref:hypothetical protein n=1 Tax=Actinopolymorpha sp. NPDC004070 TaxID=3154548 RepID=UPI00339E0F20